MRICCAVVILVGLMIPALAQAPAGAGRRGAAAAAGQGTSTRGVVGGSRDDVQEAQSQALFERITALEQRMSQTESRPSGSRTPVALTPANQFPTEPQDKADSQSLAASVDELWKAIRLLRGDLEKLNRP